MTGVLIKRGDLGTVSHTQREDDVKMQGEDGFVTRIYEPRNTKDCSKPKKLEEARNPGALRGSTALWHLDLDFRLPEL